MSCTVVSWVKSHPPKAHENPDSGPFLLGFLLKSGTVRCVVPTNYLHFTYKVPTGYLQGTYLDIYVALTLFLHATYTLTTEFFRGTFVVSYVSFAGWYYVICLWFVIMHVMVFMMCKKKISREKVPFEYLEFSW